MSSSRARPQDLTGGWNGLSGIPGPAVFGAEIGEKGIGFLTVALTVLSIAAFSRRADAIAVCSSGWRRPVRERVLTLPPVFIQQSSGSPRNAPLRRRTDCCGGSDAAAASDYSQSAQANDALAVTDGARRGSALRCASLGSDVETTPVSGRPILAEDAANQAERRRFLEALLQGASEKIREFRNVEKFSIAFSMSLSGAGSGRRQKRCVVLPRRSRHSRLCARLPGLFRASSANDTRRPQTATQAPAIFG